MRLSVLYILVCVWWCNCGCCCFGKAMKSKRNKIPWHVVSVCNDNTTQTMILNMIVSLGHQEMRMEVDQISPNTCETMSLLPKGRYFVTSVTQPNHSIDKVSGTYELTNIRTYYFVLCI
jgi:hypothetical protein